MITSTGHFNTAKAAAGPAIAITGLCLWLLVSCSKKPEAESAAATQADPVVVRKTVRIPKDYLAAMFSRDGERVAFRVAENDQYHAVVDGRREASYEALTVVEFSPQGDHYFYGGQRDGKWHLIRDGKEIAELGSLTSLHFQIAPDIRLLGEQRNSILFTSMEALAIWFSEQSDSYLTLAYQGGTGRVFQDGAWLPLQYESFYHRGMAISPDGKQHAMTVGLAAGQQATLYLNGQPITQADSISDATFVQPGNRLLYCAGTDETRRLMEGTKQVPGIGPVAGSMITSADRRHFAIPLQSANGGQTVFVDGQQEASYPEILWENPGAMFSEGGSFVWNADGTSHAYVARLKNEKDSPEAVIHNGKALDPQMDVRHSSVVLSTDGKHAAYAAKKDNGWRVVVDNAPLEVFQDIGDIRFLGASDKVVYTAKTEKGWAVHGAGASPLFEAMAGLATDPAGAHLAYAAKLGEMKWQVYVDGEPVGDPCDGVVNRPGLSVMASGTVNFTARVGDQLTWFNARASGQPARKSALDEAKAAVAKTSDQLSDDGKKNAAAGAAQRPARVPLMEQRFVLPFNETNGTEKSGSITLAGNGTGTVFLTERPGDGILFKLNAAGVSEQKIATGEGSQIRFSGRTSIGGGVLTATGGSRLCFRKSKGEWVYVCGLGEYVEAGKVHPLGSDRTVDSCLAMLAGDDALLREGAARDLGRLTTQADAARVIPRLAALLKDAPPTLRRGAIEGLGLIGDQKCFEALRAARESEGDPLVKDCMDESLSMCAARALMADPAAAQLADADAARWFFGTTDDPETNNNKFKGAAGRWRLEMSAARGSLRMEESLKSLATKVLSNDANVSAAATQLQGAIKRQNKTPLPGMMNTQTPAVAATSLAKRPDAGQTSVTSKSASAETTPRPSAASVSQSPVPSMDPAAATTSRPPTSAASTGTDTNDDRTPGAERSDNELGMKFCWCPPGVFWMGSFVAEEGRGDDELRHHVKITKGFWLGKAEVTQGEWQALMQTSLSDQAAKALQDTAEYAFGEHKMTIAKSIGGQSDAAQIIGTSNERSPMYWVSYQEAAEFCTRLTLKEQASGRLPNGWSYRLPTEAQWEHACRAVTMASYYGHNGTTGDPAFADVAWYLGNSGLMRTSMSGHASKGNGLLQPNGSSGPRQTQTKRPNGWGIHDMLGNVCEWCLDWHGYYEAEDTSDPTGALAGTLRVSRGGGWNNDSQSCRPACRTGYAPGYRSGNLGFRVALVAAPPSQAQAVSGHQQAIERPAISISAGADGKYRTFLAGQVDVKSDLDAGAEYNWFGYKAAHPLKKGDKIATQMSEDQIWSMERHSMQVGMKQAEYPIIAEVKGADGKFRSLLPAILKVKSDISPGSVIQADGFELETKRLLKAGDSISMLLVGNALLSIEAAEGSNQTDGARPFFTVFKTGTQPDERVLAMESWRIVTEHANH